jgi:oligopeptide/dipeptide ABC transporter ATP-binding protein
MQPDPAIAIRATGLSRHFTVGGGLFGARRKVRAVDGVDLTIRKGETFAIVGETGSGKSTLGRLLLRLMQPTSGDITFAGPDTDDAAFRRRAQVIFQDPYSALDPRMTVGRQIREPLDIHAIGDPAARPAMVDALLTSVGLRPAQSSSYPAELSGGQRQRVSIALALASNPDIIVADEPTSALDLSVQAQVLNLLSDLQRDRGLTLILITHDLGVVRHFCDRVAVMYLGRIVEQAATADLFAAPAHPYTQALFAAIPDPDPARRTAWQLPQGDPPSPLSPPTGCAFHPRCPRAIARCRTDTPALRDIGPGRVAACHLALPQGGQP